MPKEMTYTKALKIAKKQYPFRSEKDQRKIAKGIQLRALSRKPRKFKRLI